MVKSSTKLIKELSILLSKRSDDYLFGMFDSLLEFRTYNLNPADKKAINIMIDIVSTILYDRGILK